MTPCQNHGSLGPYSVVPDYTEQVLLSTVFSSLYLRTFMAWKLNFFHTGLLIQLTLTSMVVVFLSYSLRVLKWKLYKKKLLNNSRAVGTIWHHSVAAT